LKPVEINFLAGFCCNESAAVKTNDIFFYTIAKEGILFGRSMSVFLLDKRTAVLYTVVGYNNI